jgi:hypothetical protein
VCLLFLDRGRVTRSIPTGGLETFDWDRHQAGHTGDSGTWDIENGQLTIDWGDGGVHQGTLTVHPTGIEFYGKRYSRPGAVELADVAGHWEAAHGTAPWGGEGLISLSSLTIEADGNYAWDGTIGGVLDGSTTAEARSGTGTIHISGQTMAFNADDGSVMERTFLAVAGKPVTAFNLDAELFTRTA